MCKTSQQSWTIFSQNNTMAAPRPGGPLGNSKEEKVVAWTYHTPQYSTRDGPSMYLGRGQTQGEAAEKLYGQYQRMDQDGLYDAVSGGRKQVCLVVAGCILVARVTSTIGSVMRKQGRIFSRKKMSLIYLESLSRRVKLKKLFNGLDGVQS